MIYIRNFICVFIFSVFSQQIAAQETFRYEIFTEVINGDLLNEQQVTFEQLSFEVSCLIMETDIFNIEYISFTMYDKSDSTIVFNNQFIPDLFNNTIVNGSHILIEDKDLLVVLGNYPVPFEYFTAVSIKYRNSNVYTPEVIYDSEFGFVD